MRLLTAWAFLGVLSGAAAQDDALFRYGFRQLFDAEVLDVARFESLATSTGLPVDALLELLREAPAGDAGERRCGRILRAFRIAGPRAVRAHAGLIERLAADGFRGFRWGGGVSTTTSARGRFVLGEKSESASLGEQQEVADLLETLAVLAPYAADPAATVRDLMTACRPDRAGRRGGLRSMLAAFRAVARAQLGVLPFDRAVELMGQDDVLAAEFAARSLAAHGFAAAERLRAAAAGVRTGAVRIVTEQYSGAIDGPGVDDLVAAAAARALAEVDPDAVEAIPGLAEMLQADLPSARRRAAMALGRHGAGAAGAIEQLLAATHDADDPALVAEAVTALGMIGVRDPVVLSRLDALAAAPDRAVAARARAARRALEPR